jgi:hypothetical protein
LFLHPQYLCRKGVKRVVAIPRPRTRALLTAVARKSFWFKFADSLASFIFLERSKEPTKSQKSYHSRSCCGTSAVVPRADRRTVTSDGKYEAMSARQGEASMRGVQPLPPRKAERQVHGVHPLPPRQAERQLRGVQPLPPRKAERQLRGVQPLPSRQAERQLRGLQPLPSRQAEKSLRGVQPLPQRQAERKLLGVPHEVPPRQAKGQVRDV